MCHFSCINLNTKEKKSNLEVSRAGYGYNLKLTSSKQGSKCAMMEIRREKVDRRPKTLRTQEKSEKDMIRFEFRPSLSKFYTVSPTCSALRVMVVEGWGFIT